MNKFHLLRKAVGLDLAVAASKVGIDEMQLALFEQGIGWIHVTTAFRMSEAIETPLGAIFPLLKDLFASIEGITDDRERQAILFADDMKEILMQSGIDPDHRAWFAVLQLNSGNERRYYLTSMEYKRLRDEVLHATTSDGFLTFHSDCQNIILRKSAISSIRFCNNASYAYFASHERDFILTVVSEASPRPVKLQVTPDGWPKGQGARPFAELLAAARGDLTFAEGESEPKPAVFPAFFTLNDQPDETIVSFHGLEVIEIPCGVIMPELYEDDEEFAEGRSKDESLKAMVMMGEA